MLGSSRIVQTSLIKSAVISVVPDAASYANGQTITLSVYENSANDPINYVEADLIYNPAYLTFNSVTTNSSVFSVTASASGSNGLVTIGVGTTTPTTGNQLVATVTFTAAAAANPALITLASSCALYRNTDSRNIWNGNISYPVASFAIT